MSDDVMRRGGDTLELQCLADSHETQPLSSQPRLRVVSGGGARTCKQAPELLVVEAPRVRSAQQLALPFMRHGPATLISLGTEDLDDTRLVAILMKYTPRIAVDVRLSPSFASWGLTRSLFNTILAERNIEYRCWPELANRFVGDFLDYRLTLDRYAHYLEGHEQVRRLHELIHARGPVLLMGRLPSHQMSERGVLADALAAHGASFDLVIE